jgi:hypothetical protein
MKSTIAALAVAVSLCLCGSALGQPAAGGSGGSEPLPQSQDQRTPDAVYPSERVAGEVADGIVGLRPSPDTGGGLSTLAIALIAAGGSVALGMAALATVRVVHTHQHQPVA